MPWYVLNYVPSSTLLRTKVEGTIAKISPSLQVFAPTFVTLADKAGKVRRVEKPLLYHYVFVCGSDEEIYRLCTSGQGFSYVVDRSKDHSSPSRHITLTEMEISAFRKVALLHSGRIPCYDVTEIDLQEGDRVQVVGGDFKGLTGTYISRRGARTGNIHIAVTQRLGVVIYDIKAEYVRVLEFSRNTKRIYDQIDAFVPRLLRAGNNWRTTRQLTTADLSALTVFCRRFGIADIPNPKTEAKVKALLAAAYTLLGQHDEAGKALERYRRLSSHITNPATISLLQSLQFS